MLTTLIAADSADLQRSTQTDDKSGGIVKTWATYSPGVLVRIQDASASTQRRYAVDNIIVTHTIFTQESRGQRGDRWVSSEGRYFLIRGIEKRRTLGGIETFYVYDCEEVKVPTALGAAPALVSIVYDGITTLTFTFSSALDHGSQTAPDFRQFAMNVSGQLYTALYTGTTTFTLSAPFWNNAFSSVWYSSNEALPVGSRLVGTNGIAVASFNNVAFTGP